VLLTAADRLTFDAATGAYYICVYATTQFSAAITATEAIPENTVYTNNFNTAADRLSTMRVQKEGGVIFNRFESDGIRSGRKGKLTVYTEYDGLSASDAVPAVKYKVCQAAADSCNYDASALTSLGTDPS
jgi:hypothetical protein